MKRLLRFTRPENLSSHAGYQLIEEYAGPHESDSLRSEQSAINSLTGMVKRGKYKREFYWRFKQCLNEQGYDDAIGYMCGNHMDSAACSYCRFIARVRIAELFSNRKLFKKKCWQITIVDTQSDVRENELIHYDLDQFRNEVDQALKIAGGQLKALGQFEFQIVERPGGQTVWSPHLHMIASGRSTRAFVDALREAFPPKFSQQRPLMRKRLHTLSDVQRAAVYQFKSSAARRRGVPSLSAEQLLELNKFLFAKSCSDLLWIKGMNFHGARVELSTLRDLDIWHFIENEQRYFEEAYTQRIVPRVPYATRRLLFDSNGELKVDAVRQRAQEITAYFANDPILLPERRAE